MYKLLKSVLKRTPLYAPLEYYAHTARAARVILKWSEQDDKMAAFYGRFLKPDDLVFDVGANIGGRTKVFLHLRCRVVAAEPQAFCVAVLKRAFGRRIAILDRAVSDSVGSAQLYTGPIPVFASMSREWINCTVESGRFSKDTWDRTETVGTTTLDVMCRQFGKPAFVKIDVEGHEDAVLRGLSVPIGLLSLEFALEYMQAAYSSLAQLDRIGPYRYNYSLGESMELQLAQWTSLSDIQMHLSQVGATAWGDVYAKLQ